MESARDGEARASDVLERSLSLSWIALCLMARDMIPSCREAAEELASSTTQRGNERESEWGRESSKRKGEL